jgi:hypothetical protein
MWMERCQSVMHPHLVMQAKPDHAQKICVLGMLAKFRNTVYQMKSTDEKFHS